MKLMFLLDNYRIEAHEIMMTDVVMCIDEYWEYLTEHFDGTPPEIIERLVISYSDALWVEVLKKNLKVEAFNWREFWCGFKQWVKAQVDYFCKDWEE